MKKFFISEGDFRVWLPNVQFIEKSEDDYNSRRLRGIMSTQRIDRQGESVVAKGLEFDDFLHHGHFNDNHSQETSAIVGYPESVQYHKSMEEYGGPKSEGWTCEGFVLKGTKRSDGIWELAKALAEVPNRKLGFSIEGKVIRRNDKTIEKARIRNVAITNCPVNTDCFPGDVSVVGAGEKVFQRLYSGLMIEVVLSTGEKLTGTPNHPVLTQFGWVPLGQLDKTRHRIARSLGNTVSASRISRDVNDMPATLEEIFNFTSVIPSNKRVYSARKEQFHGDGTSSGDVNIVLIDGKLKNRLDTAFFQKFGEGAFVASQLGERILPYQSFCNKLGFGSTLASSNPIRSFSEEFALSEREVLVSNGHGFTHGSNRNSSISHDSGHCFVSNSKLSAYSDRTLSMPIGFSDISRKRSFGFSGHVYNLQTAHDWYSANGIIAHNCTWEVLDKSFASEEVAMKSMMAGYGASPGTQTGGGAMRGESLDSDEKVSQDEKKKKRVAALKKALLFDDMEKAMEIVLDRRPDMDEEAAAYFVNYLFKKGGML